MRSSSPPAVEKAAASASLGDRVANSSAPAWRRRQPSSTSAAENAFVSGITISSRARLLAVAPRRRQDFSSLRFLPTSTSREHEGTPDEPTEIEERTELGLAEVTASPYS